VEPSVGGLEGAISAHERAIAADRLSGPPVRAARAGRGRPLSPQSVDLLEHVLSCLWCLSDRRRTMSDPGSREKG
jgi:hypothetical protein